MFSKNLREIRKAKGLTREKLAELLHVSWQTIGHWEQGYTEPSLTMLTKLRDVLNASYDELLD